MADQDIPAGPPTEWPAATTGGPPPSPSAASGRRRGPWVAGAGVALGLVAVGVGAAVVLGGGDGPDDEAYCAALAETARVDVPAIVFLRTDVDAGAVEDVRAVLDGEDGIEDLVYVDAEASFAEAQELFADEPSMVALLRPEDVPTSFRFVGPDLATTEAALEAVEDVEAVEQTARSTFARETAEEMIRALAELDLEGSPGGRFGHVVDPRLAARLRADAPGEVAEDLDLVLDVLATDDGEAGDEHQAASDAVIDDSERRCA